ncbi:condensation domain-containing protein [Rhizobium leguminosarum]|uniref:condensation domain-containing protein n=1 Tax=Rhizobium leguminosarum TaxID=384 RepID=UPI001F41AD4A|nr:condensation domain-containing protein [Rhizobium leguminosarum]
MNSVSFTRRSRLDGTILCRRWIQYPDYAAWQRQWLSGERLQSQAQYWRDTLSGAPARLALPTDRARPAQQSFAGASGLLSSMRI